MSPKRKVLIRILVLIVVAAGAVAGWRWSRARHTQPDTLTLYGNIDFRQVQLAFNASERIQKLLVDEGSVVHRGELLGQLEQSRLKDIVAQDQGKVAAQQDVVARMLAGSRPEEIAVARADLAAARADSSAAEANLANAKLLYHRQQNLAGQHYVSLQIRDDAQRALLAAQAALAASKERVAAREQTLKLAVLGPRREDIAAAQATLRANEAALSLAETTQADTQLYAPEDGVIENRILQPGDMATPQSPAFTLALDNPVWARAWLPETALGRVSTGMEAWITSDSFPGKRFRGWVGFISPVAEFTPRNVETTALRTQLVYRVRVFACNPDHRLRLGMPVTVTVPLSGNASGTMTHTCGK